MSEQKQNSKYEIGKDLLTLSTLSPQKDINKNQQIRFEEDEGLLYTFFNILIKYGHGILGVSFTLGKTRSGDGKTKYFIKKNKFVERVYAAAYAFICLYWFIQITGEKFAVTNFKIINWIKRGTHIALMFQLVIMKYDWEKSESHNNLLTMLREADTLQAKFANCKIFFPRKENVRKLAYLIAASSLIWTFVQLALFSTGTGGIRKFAGFAFRFCTLNLVDVDEHLKPSLLNTFCALGLTLDALPWSIFHFAGAVRIFSVLSVWVIFHRLTRALDSGGVLEHKSLAQVMDLHLSATHILHLMNEIFSSLTFCSTVYTFLYACFWLNHLIKAEEFSRIYIVCVFFVVKSAFILLIAADVNSKAHRITFWLEKFAGANPSPISSSAVDPKAMSIWTCQLYNKEAIGFKGLNYFTITSSFISATVGLIITYTAVVVQFLEMDPNQITKVVANSTQTVGSN